MATEKTQTLFGGSVRASARLGVDHRLWQVRLYPTATLGHLCNVGRSGNRTDNVMTAFSNHTPLTIAARRPTRKILLGRMLRRLVLWSISSEPYRCSLGGTTASVEV